MKSARTLSKGDLDLESMEGSRRVSAPLNIHLHSESEFTWLGKHGQSSYLKVEMTRGYQGKSTYIKT